MSGFLSGHCPGDAAASGDNPGCAGRFPAAALGRCPRSIQADPVRQPRSAGACIGGEGVPCPFAFKS